MENSINTSLSENIKNLTQAFFNLIKDTLKLAGAEAQQTGKSIVQIGILLPLIRIIAVITWLSICGVIALYLISLQYTWLFAFCCLALLNFTLLVTLGLLLLNAKKYLGFPATRRQLQVSQYSEKNLSKDYYHE